MQINKKLSQSIYEDAGQEKMEKAFDHVADCIIRYLDHNDIQKLGTDLLN